jgi:hypothetical protein
MVRHYNGQKFEDTKGVIRSPLLMKDRDYSMTKRKQTNGQTTIYETLHRRLNIEQNEPH